MKTFAYARAIAILGISVAAGAATPEDQLLAPIRLMVDSFNKGDMKTAATAVAPGGIRFARIRRSTGCCFSSSTR